MSYPRNAATPKPVVVGRITLIADGSAVVTGASVRVQLDAGGWGAGGGTLAYDATSEVCTYAPTQAETNGDVLQIAVYKAACMGCSVTVLMDPATVTLANGAHGGAAATITLQTPIAATVPDTQKVDVNTIKTKAVTVDVGGTTFPASVGTSTFAGGAVQSVADPVTTTVTPDAAGTLAGLIGAKGGLPKLDATNGLVIQGFGSGGVTVGTVTTLTNLPAVTTDWLTAAGVKADAVTKIQDGLSTLDAAGIRTAVGLGSANLDTQLDAIPTVTEFNARTIVSADYFVVEDYTVPPTTAQIKTAIEAAGGHLALILADTGTDGVKLADDAITGAKFDESTAFPLKSADTGSTQVARVGADADTLETLSDQIDAVTTGGTGHPTATITVKDTNTDGAVIASVSVVILDDTNTDVVESGTTNGSGVAAINVSSNGPYKVRLHASGWIQSTNPETLTVSGDTADEYYMTAFSPGTPSPDLVRIYSWEFKSNGGTPVSGATVTAWPSDRGEHTAEGGVAYVVAHRISTTTDANGYWYLDLYPGLRYDVDLSATRDKTYERVTIPAANAQLESLI